MQPTDRFGGTGQIDRYATHLRPLVDTVMRTRGGILELGCGYYSTPVLAAISHHQRRGYEAHASDAAWAKEIQKTLGLVGFQIVSDWEAWMPPRGPWSVCLLDHEQHTRDRIRHLPALAKVCEYVVVHDADAAMNHAHWEECAAEFAVESVFKKLSPWTAVLRSRHVKW